MANTEINPFAYNPAAAASLFGAQPPPPEQALPEEDMSQYMPQPQPQQAPTSSYEDAFQKAEGQYGLPEGLLSTIGYHESRFNPDAVSPKGATGVMQLMPRTAREYGVNARDPYASIDAAGKKMAGLVKYYNGDIVKAVAAYNYGEGNLNRAIRDAGEDWVSAIPKETQDYVTNVLGGAPTSEQESPKGDTYEIPLSNGGSLHVPVGMSKEQAIAEARAHGIDAVGLRDVPLANGGTLHVPDNMSDEQAVAEAQKADPTTDFSLLKKEGDSRTFGKGLEDVGVTAAKAASGFIQSTIGLVDLLTPGNLGGAVEDAGLDLAKIQEYLGTQYTPQQQEHIKAFADAHGWKAILQAAKDHPQALVTALAESVPQIIGGAGIAKAGLMGAAKVLSKVPAAAPYFAAGIGEAGMGAGAQRESLRVTNPEGEASGKNTEAALLTGAGTGIFGAAGAKLTTALGGIDPMLLISGNARQMAIHELGAAAAKPGFFRSTLVSMLGEGVFQELPQSVVEQLDQNFATDKPLFEGVEDAGVKGAIMGALMGGGGNAISQVAGTTEQAPPPPPPPAPVTPPVSEIPVPPEGGVVAPPVNPLIITPEERARIIAAEHGAEKGSLMGALTDRVNPSELAGAPAEEVVAGAPADIVAGAPAEEVVGAPAEEVVGEPVAEVAAVEEPIVRGKKENPVKTEPTWVTDMLGLHKKSGLYKKIATQGLDINNPADHDAIRKITDPVIADLKKAGTITEEQSKILPNYMDAIQQGQTTPIIEGATTDAQQIPSTSSINGDGSTQSQESQAAEDITQAGKGMESSGQGIEAIETGGQEEEVTPAVSSVMVAAANKVLEDYKEKPISRNIGRLRTIAETLELPVTVDTPHAEVYDLVSKAITPARDMGRGIQVNANEQGIDSVINKAGKKDEGEVGVEGVSYIPRDEMYAEHYEHTTDKGEASIDTAGRGLYITSNNPAQTYNIKAINAQDRGEILYLETANKGKVSVDYVKGNITFTGRNKSGVPVPLAHFNIVENNLSDLLNSKYGSKELNKILYDSLTKPPEEGALHVIDKLGFGNSASKLFNAASTGLWRKYHPDYIDEYNKERGQSKTKDGVVDEGEVGEYEKNQLIVQGFADKKAAREAAEAKIAADDAARVLQNQKDAEAKKLLAAQSKKVKKGVKKVVEEDTDEDVEDTTKTLSDDSIYESEDDNDITELFDFGDRYQESVAPTSELTGHTAASLSKTLSPEMKRLVASGKAVMHDTAETLPEGKHPENVQGLTTAEGVTHYVANKLTPETLESVALHEVGTHVGMENLVGAKVYKDIANQALNNVGEVFDKARASIPKDTPTHLRHHEALAYLVENAPNLPVVKKIVSAVRNFARMHLGMKLQLTEADARHLAIKALRKESKTTKRTARKEGTAYSIKPSQDAQDIGASLNAAHLVKSSDKSFITSIKEGLASLKTGNNIVKLRAGWVDKTAGLSRLLKPLDMFDAKGTLRADMLIQANEQLYNVIRNSDGYLVYAGDGTLMSVADKRLALEDIFKRIDALGYKDSRKTFFTAMRVLTGEQSLLKDAEQRIEAANYKTFAGLLQKDLDKLTGALVDTRRALAAAAVSGDKAAVASLKKDIQVINEEHTKLSRRIAQLKEESNRLFRKHGKKSAVDIQADIDAKETKAQAKEALAATTADKTKRDALLDQVERLRNDADRLAKVLEAGVGTEKRVDAQQIAEVKELLAKDPRLEPIMGDIWEGLRKLVDLWEVGGLIDAPIANEWRDNPAYIPLYKSMDDLLDDPSGYVEILKVGAKQLGEVKAREGGKHSVNVGENLIKHQAFMAGAAAQNTARRIAVEQMSSMSPDTVYKSGPDDPQATMFRVNGEKVYYHISDPVAFEAFQTMLPILPTWAKVAQVHTRAFRAVTLVNPLYWYRQLIRDPMMASLVTQSGLITPLHAAYHMAKILSGVSKEYKTLKRHGIVGAVDSLTDPKQFVQGIAAKRGIKKKAIDVLMHIHESTDAATRVAVYKAAYKASLKKGIIDPQKRENYAAMQAREVINFSKKGNAKSIATIRATIPFFSAQLNGMDTLARAAMPGSYGNLNAKDAATVRKHFYANAAMLTTASILYALQMDDDEEYKKSPDWLNSWLVPTGNKDNPFIKIPIPFEAGFCFKVVPEILVRVAKYSLTPKEGVEALGTAAKTLLLPPMIPQLFKPLAEVITNYDLHTGNNIESYTESKLPLNQRTAHATPLAEVIAKGVPDFLNMSPDKIEHLGKGWLTEAWALSALIAEAYLNTTGTSAPTKELGEQFLWKGIYTAPAKDVNLNKYYNLSKAAEQIVSGVRAYRKEGSREEAKAMKAEPESKALLKAAPMFDAAGEQIGAMQAHINRIKHKPDSEMSPDEKAKRIRIIQERINKRADRAIERADKIGVER
jgi:hypothetical protein